MPLLSSKGLAFYRLKSLGEGRHHAADISYVGWQDQRVGFLC